MLPPLRQVAVCALLVLAVLIQCPRAEAAPSQFGSPNGQGVFDITATVPNGHGNGYFELSTDSAFRLDVTTKAGTANSKGFIDGAAAVAQFSTPASVARDSIGNLFVADSGNNRIRMITPAGVTSTIAGGGYGFADGLGSNARFAFPSGVAVGPGDNNVYVSDTNNTCIRKLTRPAVDGAPWMVTTLAGTNTSGFFDGSGSTARFSSPQGLVVDSSGNVYVADAGNHRIRKITSTGSVTTYAGTTGGGGYAEGAAVTLAKFNSPYGVVLDSLGNLFVADRLNHRIRRITPGGMVSTYAGAGTAGSADGALASSTFNRPVGLAIDAFDTLYVSDEQNHKIRRVTPVGGPDQVQTVAGTGVAGFANGPATVAPFNYPAGLAVVANGDLIVADSENQCLRRIASSVSVAAVGNSVLPNVKATIDPAALGVPPGTYYFRWRAGDWTVQNEGLNKYITSVVPAVTTVAASPVNAAEASLNATVNPRGLVVSEVKFQYSTDPAFGTPLEAQVTPLPGIGSADVAVSWVLSFPTNTLPGTVYYFRVVARNQYGTATATDILSFTVPTTQVVTAAATSIVRTAVMSHLATLNATVDPKVSSMAVSFEYSTQPGLIDSWLVSTPVASPNAGGARGVAVDLGGNSYYSRRDLNRVDQSGVRLAGDVAPGLVNGSLVDARFDHPAGVALYNPNVGTKILYVGDEYNHCVRKINLLTGTVSTLAGSGLAGFTDGASASARFLYPTGVAVDSVGNVYVADTGNHCIRKINVGSGTVSTLAGTGVAGQADGEGVTAKFRSPLALAVGVDGTVYVADTGNHRICKISTGNIVSAISGGGGTGFMDDDDTDPSTGAKFSSPSGITVDSSSTLFIADSGNHCIRRITSDGRVTTIAGSGVAGWVDSPASGNGLIPGTATRFSSPSAIANDGSGNLFVTEAGNNLDLRKIIPGTLQTVTATPGITSSQAVSANTHTLSPGTTYYYRAVGDNRLDGVIQGEILSFTTYTEPAIVVHNGGSTSALAVSQPLLTPINFGIQGLATPITRQFTIANNGGWLLTVNSIGLPSQYTSPDVVTTIPVGESRTFSVTLGAVTPAVFSGDIAIACDDPAYTSFFIPVTGKKVNPPVINSIDLKDITLLPTSATLIADVNTNGADTTFEFEVSPGPDFEGVRVDTMAGATTGYADGKGVAAQLNTPKGLAVDAAGNVFVADTLNHIIRKITPAGDVSTIAGTGVAGFADGSVTSAQFDGPTGIAVGNDGTIYVADTNNNRIRAISTSDQVTTLSGTGEAGFTDGVVTAVRFNKPAGLALDAAGILYVADWGNHRVRKVSMDGSAMTLANFSGVSAPSGVTVSSDGTVYVADEGAHLIRKVTAVGAVTTLAGSGVVGSANGTGSLATFDTPVGIVLDEAAERLYVVDQAVHLVRKITLDGTVTTLAGTGTQGVIDGLGTVAQFDAPLSVALLRTKTVIVGEVGGSTIRQITPTVIKVPASDVLINDGVVTLSLSGLDPGVIYYFRAIAVSVGGRAVSDAPLVGTAFTQWQIDNFGPAAVDPLISGPEANPTKDRVSNLMKYALGLNPNVCALTGLPVVRFDHPSPGFFSLSINRNPAATNVRIIYEGSTDQLNWSTAGIQVSSDNTLGYLPYMDVPRRFIRLGVQLVLP